MTHPTSKDIATSPPSQEEDLCKNANRRRAEKAVKLLLHSRSKLHEISDKLMKDECSAINK